ncbi:aldose epimerase family protein [Lentzea sp. NPDC059081]|uniref:aldose epimerase family protein n=1 Tax=Lentzea sp. NPDC059081 TaxID=3346719 RepID=UPI003684C748
MRSWTVGTTPGGAHQGPMAVDAYELTGADGLRAVVWTYGATLAELWVPDGTGGSVNVVLGHPDLTAYLEPRNHYLGATLGRYSRNVGFGRFRLDGAEHLLDLNDRGHHMHGGVDGFSRRVWTARPEADGTALRLRLVSPDGDQGYPGELVAETVYRLVEHGIEFEHSATTSSPTIVDLTNHSYWNLAGTGTVDDHLLTIAATRVIEFDQRMVPSAGPPPPVAGGPLDFTSPRPLRGCTADRFFVLDGPQPAVELSHPGSGRTMRIRTTAPGIGVYTADRFPTGARSGICLQASALPDAPNRPDFPTVRLDPRAIYHSRTVHEFVLG